MNDCILSNAIVLCRSISVLEKNWVTSLGGVVVLLFQEHLFTRIIEILREKKKEKSD